ncbi:MAG: protein kinase [Phycisphaeraceae bacterium]|nr:protein kinase [Phycisphaeraceae bacterium]
MEPEIARLRAVFDEAIAANPGDRPALLERLCEGNAVLRKRVEGMLVAAESEGGFLSDLTRDRDVSLGFGETREEAARETAGMRIGKYKLLQRIGEGGFGTVFLAEQEQPVRRKVALKIIKAGMDSRAVVARFEAERQALAIMDHPHIARVLDGGLTDASPAGGGRPYFVMEYVVGDPITLFADAHKLNVQERLELFAQVCAAVQHAHTKGIIHRDLKPGNVLVSMVDGRPFAKVIDFGIAKSLASPLTDKTLFTEHRQLIGTPEYMSPEQAEGSPDIDTRTDVYALGVLLYQLLTGLTPFDSMRLRSAAYAEIQRIIKEEDPPAPSVRLSREVHALAATASSRRVEPAKLGLLIQGELDWIVMKALDKDRARRYETPNQLAADVQRHLAGEAVVAAPPSAAYRLRKFVRRNKGPVLAGTAVAAALLVGIAGTTWQWQRASRFYREADAQAELAGRNAARAELALERTRVQLEFASRSGRALLALLDGNGEHPDVEFVRSINSELDAPTGPYDPDFAARGIGTDLKAFSAVALDTARKVLEAQQLLKAQVKKAEQKAYVANVFAAASDPAGARDRLEACPEELRGWEWQYLNAGVDTSTWSDHQGRWGWLFGFALEGSRFLTNVPGRGGLQIRDTKTGEVLFAGLEGWGVNNAQFSLDGQRICLTGIDPLHGGWRPAVLDVRTGILTRLPSFDDDAWVSFVNGGAQFVTVRRFYHDDSEPVRIWDTLTGELRATINRRVGGYAWGAATLHGHYVVTRSGEGLEVWDAMSGARAGVLDIDANTVLSVSLSPDGSKVLALADGALHAWKITTGERLFSTSIGSLRYFDPGTRLWSFSSDGSKVALSGWGRVAPVFDANTGAHLVSIPCQPEEVWFDAELSPDGTKLLTTGGTTPHLWDVATGRYLSSFVGHARVVREARISPDGEWVVATAYDGALRAWRTDTPPNPIVLRVPQYVKDTVAADGFDSAILVRPHCLEVRPVPGFPDEAAWYSLAGLPRVGIERSECRSLAFTPDGGKLLFTSHASIFEFDLRTREIALERCHLDEYGGYVWTGVDLLGLDAAGAFWSWRQSVQRWLPGDARPAWRLVHPAIGGFDPAAQEEERIPQQRHVEVSRDGQRMLMLLDHGAVWPRSTSGRGKYRPGTTMLLCDAATGEILLERQVQSGFALYLPGLNSDGSRVAVLEQHEGLNVCRVIDVSTGAERSIVADFLPHNASCEFSPDGSRLLIVHAGAVSVWDTDTAEQVAVFESTRYESDASFVRFSPDATSALMVMGGTVLLVDVRDWQIIADLSGHIDTITDAAFSPDGSRVVTASHDQSLRFCDSVTGDLLMVYREHAPVVLDEGGVGVPSIGFNCVAFSSDGTRLAAGTVDGRVLILDTIHWRDRNRHSHASE